MSDTTLGYLLVALGIVFALVIVFTAVSRDSRSGRGAAGVDGELHQTPSHPPAGVHLPPPSWLPLVMAVAGAFLAAGLIFSPWALLPGVVVLLAGAFGWYRAAGREWRGVAHGEHHDGRAHE